MATIVQDDVELLDFDKDFREGVYIQYNIPREDIHISDIVICPRKSAFSRILRRGELSEDSCDNFFSGEIIDDKVKCAVSLIKQRLHEGLGTEYSIKEEFNFNGLIGRPDVVHRSDNVVIEIKSTRKDPKQIVDKPDYHYIKQLKYYMAVMNSPYGILYYIILVKKDKKMAPKYQKRRVQHHIRFKDNRERLEILQEMNKHYQAVKLAIEQKDPSLAPHIATDLNYAREDKDGKPIIGTNWMCSFCEFKKQCDEIRAKDGEFTKRQEEAYIKRLQDKDLI